MMADGRCLCLSTRVDLRVVAFLLVFIFMYRMRQYDHCHKAVSPGLILGLCKSPINFRMKFGIFEDVQDCIFFFLSFVLISLNTR